MTIKFDENTVGIWYVQLSDVSDWLASIRMDDGKGKLCYRFRYYKDDKVFESEDRKQWYDLETDDTEELIKAVRMLAEFMAADAGDEVYELMMSDCDGFDDFTAEFSKAPFVSMKVESLH